MPKIHGIEFRQAAGECWECTSHRPNNSGYPCRHGGLVHRFIFSKENGEIPAGLCVLHVCDNRLCINPDHLWLGTHLDNQMDKVSKGRQAKLAGSKNPRAKLKENDVLRIIKDKRYIKEIAKDYSVSFQMVSRIKRREAWNALEI